MGVYALLNELRNLEREPVLLVADGIKKVDGPGGTWRIRMGRNANNAWQFSIHGPKQEVYYSIRTALRALEEFLPEQDADDGRLLLAATIINNRVRTWMTVRMLREKAQIRNRICSLESCISLTLHRLHKGAEAETMLVKTTPPILVHYLTHLHTALPTSETLHPGDMMDRLMMTREQLTRLATDAKETYATGSIMFEGGMALTSTMIRAPLILGTLPLPTGTRVFEIRNKTIVIENTPRISPLHCTALAREFSIGWATHQEKLISDKMVSAYDFFSDRARTIYLGSVVVNKLLVRKNGIYSAAISVESIVSQRKNSGAGAYMVEFVRRLLFTDARNTSHGYIFAQCLKVPFWTFKLDNCILARALVFQMQHSFAYYVFEEECTPRALRVDAIDDFASPKKK